MSAKVPWKIEVVDHPGSTAEEIANEPDWDAVHPHRIGFKNGERFVGISADGADDYAAEIEEARKIQDELKKGIAAGKLVNFRDLVTHQKDFHLKHPENRSLGWRYVLDATENWVKNVEEWPANIEKRKKQEEKEKKEKVLKKEIEWKRAQGNDDKHNDAYAVGSDSGYDSRDAEEEKDSQGSDSDQEPKYSPQELALLRTLKHESQYISQLQQDDGKGKSPQTKNRTDITIDEQDQFSPDNWLPRSRNLVRLTGNHPLNAEPELTRLYEAGLITPNELHYVRNHGAVPRILWEFHRLDIENGSLVLSMKDLQEKYEPINIPVAIACNGNRRKELNMIRKSKGFGWGAGGVSCAYWKGALLRDVLISAGINPNAGRETNQRLYVNFEGSEELSGGKYATCIPFDYVMDPTNDVMLAYEMNDLPIPPDHGYPVRVVVPGFVGGRCVKWLRRVWVSDKENDSYYHIWDNRVLPSFVTEKDGDFAETMYKHPSTACYEQNLQSVICRPAQGEKISLKEAQKGNSYRVAGFAYNGGGHQIQRVDVSLDGGETWLYCIREFPDRPIRHGNKFWTWLHWHVDVETSHLLRAKSIAVRCFSVFKNTQPERPIWNTMGLMNNCWYVVKPEIVVDEDDDVPSILFRHPTEPASGEGGWLKPSVENQIEAAKQQAGVPQKQFTRQEVEKHDKENDCWIVVDGKVYDATSVLAWHPGGKASIMPHAGKVHHLTTEEFASIHDGFAYEKLKECAIGVLTDRAANYVKKQAEQAAKEKASSEQKNEQLVLQRHRWVPVTLIDRKSISEDTRVYTFALPDGKAVLGLGTGQHVQIGFHMKDRMLIRSYTPTRPILPAQIDATQTLEDDGAKDDPSKRGLRDGDGTFDLTIKTYFPDEKQPGGAMSNILDCVEIGSEVELRGPTGEITYNGNGNFTIEGRERHFDRVSLVLGGSGITPGYSLLARVLLTEGDATRLRVVDANKTEKDILLRQELEDFQAKSGGQLEVTHVLSEPDDSWKGLRGFVTKEIFEKHLFEPSESSVVFLCGPPVMIQKAALPALKEWGYRDDENIFGF